MTQTCALCGRTMPYGEAGVTVDGKTVPLCHPFLGDSQDCYRLVTVYGHELPTPPEETE